MCPGARSASVSSEKFCGIRADPRRGWEGVQRGGVLCVLASVARPFLAPPAPSGQRDLRRGQRPAEGAAGWGGSAERGRARQRAGSGPASYAGSCGRSWRHFLERRRPLPGHLGVGCGGARRGAGRARARHGRGGRRGAGVLSPGRWPGMGVFLGPAACWG